MTNIPKIIHYCWFGRNKMPKSSIKYIDGWKKKCPNFKIICWSEKNFPINNYKFTKEAYSEHNWAALSDYVRFVVLYKFGGIYLDTDVEIIKSLNPLLVNNSFVGLEDYGVINSGLIYGTKFHDGHVKKLINIYNFISNKPDFHNYMNDQVHIITTYFHKLGFKYNNNLQHINGCTIYPTDYFCPMKYGSKKINLTNNTYTIHHYFGSWVNKSFASKDERHELFRKVLRMALGTKLFFYLYRRHLMNKKGNI